MKNTLSLIVLTFILFSCNSEPKDYVTLSGKFTNLDLKVDSVIIIQEDGSKKKQIVLNKDGTFKDTLKVKEGNYIMMVGDEYLWFYLVNGNKINITCNYPEFDETLKFEGKGKGVEISNLYISSSLLLQKHLNENVLEKPRAEFNKEINILQQEFEALKNKHGKMDSVVINKLNNEFEHSIQATNNHYNKIISIKEKFSGSTSPDFAYQNTNDEIITLASLKGQYVYINFWATWCGTCKYEIPYLKELEEEYKYKNIEFVSISVDPIKNKEKWLNFIKDKNLKNTQLITDNSYNSEFLIAYEVREIPRFILIDPNGITLDPYASQPSSPRIKELLNSLNL